MNEVEILTLEQNRNEFAALNNGQRFDSKIFYF